MLPADMRVHVLRCVLDTVSDEVRGARLAPALAARLDLMVEDARRHAKELEETLQPASPSSPPPRRFVGHREVGSNVIELRAR